MPSGRLRLQQNPFADLMKPGQQSQQVIGKSRGEKFYNLLMFLSDAHGGVRRRRKSQFRSTREHEARERARASAAEANIETDNRVVPVSECAAFNFKSSSNYSQYLTSGGVSLCNHSQVHGRSSESQEIWGHF